MNTTITYTRPFIVLDTEAMQLASRTIEVIGNGQEIAYVYNHDGQNFSLFPTLIDLLGYFEGNKFNRVSFENEEGYNTLFINDTPITLILDLD